MTLPSIATLLQQYPIGDIHAVSLLQMGAENENYLVTTQSDKVVLRVYNQNHSLRGARTLAQIELELAFSERAQQAGLPTPPVIKTNDANRVFTLERDSVSQFVVLFGFLNGKILPQYSTTSAIALGRVVSQMVAVGETFNTLDMDMHYGMMSRADREVRKLQAQGKHLPERIRKLWQNVAAQKSTILSEDLLTGLVHGDLKLGNLLFDETEAITGVLDFDDYRFSYLLEDPVMALFHELHDEQKNLLRSGFYQPFIDTLQHSVLQNDLRHFRFFLQGRLCLDVALYLQSDLYDLVDELLNDDEIIKHILNELE